MHPSAYKSCEVFSNKYITSNNLNILDVGSLDVNGTLKAIFKNHRYIGMDMSEGINVDVVYDGNSFPFDNNSFDIIVSSSCFEHDEFFWNTFLEMCRILKNGGYIFINTPSRGYYHAHPVDCWRFYADSYAALCKWAIKNEFNIKLIEQFIIDESIWADNVGIFMKQ